MATVQYLLLMREAEGRETKKKRKREGTEKTGRGEIAENGKRERSSSFSVANA